MGGNDSRSQIRRRPWAERDPVYRRADLYVGGTVLAIGAAWVITLLLLLQ